MKSKCFLAPVLLLFVVAIIACVAVAQPVVDKVLKEEGSLRHRKLRLEEIVKTKTLLGKKLLHLDKLTKIFDGKEEKIVEFKREINFLIKRLNAGVTPDNK